MIPKPTGFKVITEEGNRGVYDVEGLYPGYGHTVGNSIRRVLLSSLTGSAITAVKIKGVSHEFSTIEGVLEDVVEIILNLKQVRFKMTGEGPYQATLSIKGEKAVTAGDIRTPGELEIVNPDLHIATLSAKTSELEMDIEVSSGTGYQTIESRKKEKVDIGSIALDAAFSPVRIVNFEVENMRVGDRTDYNKVRFTLETDGSINPREALIESSKILTEQFAALGGVEPVFAESRELPAPPTPSKKHEAVAAAEEGSYEEKTSKMAIEDLKLSNRTMNALEKSGFKIIGELSGRTEEELRDSVRGLGDKGIVEIKKALGNLGLTFKQ